MVRFGEDEVVEREKSGSVQFQSRLSSLVQIRCIVVGQSKEVRVVSAQRVVQGVSRGSPGRVLKVQIAFRMSCSESQVEESSDSARLEEQR